MVLLNRSVAVSFSCSVLGRSLAARADLAKQIVAQVQQPILRSRAMRRQGGLRGHRQRAMTAPQGLACATELPGLPRALILHEPVAATA